MKKTPLEKLREDKKFKKVRESILKFPIDILDKYSVDFYLEYDNFLTSLTGNDVLAL